MSHRDANTELDTAKLANDSTAVDLQPNDAVDNMIRGKITSCAPADRPTALIYFN